MTAAIAVRGLSFAFPGSEPILRNVEFSILGGEFVALLGPNGAGKSTLLRCLLGLLAPAAGAIDIGGQPLAGMTAVERARRLAYVPQTPAAGFAFTAGEVVMLGRHARLGWLGLPTAADVEVARAAMEMTGTARLAGRLFSALSGGEAQRVAIARALAQQPAVLLLDEPTSHLDLRHQVEVCEMLRRVAHDWPMAVLCVLHDLRQALRFSDRAMVLHDGVVAADGPPADVLSPAMARRVYGVEIETGTSLGGAPWVAVVGVSAVEGGGPPAPSR